MSSDLEHLNEALGIDRLPLVPVADIMESGRRAARRRRYRRIAAGGVAGSLIAAIGFASVFMPMEVKNDDGAPMARDRDKPRDVVESVPIAEVPLGVVGTNGRATATLYVGQVSKSPLREVADQLGLDPPLGVRDCAMTVVVRGLRPSDRGQVKFTDFESGRSVQGFRASQPNGGVLIGGLGLALFPTTRGATMEIGSRLALEQSVTETDHVVMTLVDVTGIRQSWKVGEESTVVCDGYPRLPATATAEAAPVD